MFGLKTAVFTPHHLLKPPATFPILHRDAPDKVFILYFPENW